MHVHPFSDKRKALQKNEAVELEGMIYYPLLVEDYEIWQALAASGHSPCTIRRASIP